MNIPETVGYLLNLIFFNNLSNLVMITLLCLTVLGLFYISLFLKHTFCKPYRIGFVLLALGFIHNILVRLTVSGLLDEFFLIDVPISSACILVQTGAIVITLTYLLRLTQSKRDCND